VDDPDHAIVCTDPAPAGRSGSWLTPVVILIVFVFVAFIGIPVFLSWKRNRG